MLGTWPHKIVHLLALGMLSRLCGICFSNAMTYHAHMFPPARCCGIRAITHPLPNRRLARVPSFSASLLLLLFQDLNRP